MEGRGRQEDLWVQGQPDLQRETLSHEEKKKEIRKEKKEGRKEGYDSCALLSPTIANH